MNADESKTYDPFKREPLFCNATGSQPFELLALSQHTHPTVRSFAAHILARPDEQLQYTGDPLLDFSLANFLDRIAYKEPKSEAKLAKFEKNRKLSEYAKPINQIDLEADDAELRDDEAYIVKFLQEKKKYEKPKKDLEDEDDEEAFADKAIRAKMKELAQGGASDEDEDIDVDYSDDDEVAD